ncbi:uncharacterized protein [Primulina eburnea]|uniref:uncharacterized protein n=1 Tax=Primulina eburnea TaxID=1245227 RepID=UPI003C6C0FE4
MLDHFVLGLDHLYAKPVYMNLKDNISSHDQAPLTSPSWCIAPFDPEGILSSITAAVACIIGLHYGHTLIQLQHHKEQPWNWSVYSVLLIVLRLLLAFSADESDSATYTAENSESCMPKWVGTCIHKYTLSQFVL